MGSSNKHGEQLAALSESGRSPVVAHEAATVILLRDSDTGVETLMLKRNSKVAFGGMWVFPGGRVDDEDRTDSDPDNLASARRAAVRESQEEAGLALEEAGLVAYSHWTPPSISPRRFLTWFFVTRAPETEVSIDGGEIRKHEWMRPADALQRRDAGEIELAVPTFVTLHELSQRSATEDALAHARGRDPERFATCIARVDDGAVALWHGDAGYETATPDLPGPRHRLWMVGSGWRYERSPG